jgi:hypothetical protein
VTSHKAAWLLALVTLVLPLSGVLAGVAGAQTPPGVTKSVDRGFGDPANRMSWSMAWFKGKLYVGTSRENSCVELATIAAYGVGDYYSTVPGPDLSCPADRYDLRLQAEIWQYTPETEVWKRVYQSPQDIPNPRAPGKFVARDIGFRGMVVKREADGTEALYVGGVTANEYIPEIAAANPPRILRTTDGESFTPLAGVPNIITTTFGRQHLVGFRAMVVYNDRLLVTATQGLLGDGVILEVKNADGAEPTFEQVSPPNLRIFELEIFNGQVYLGTGDLERGYSLYRTDATGSPFTVRPIITQGGGRGSTMTSVVSMHVFKGRLYVGSNGYATLLPQSELVRVNADDTWQLVTGNPRFAADGSFKYPITGLPDGFGNYFTSHFWRQQTHEGALYVGTLDSTWGLRVVPGLEVFLRPEMGFDVYGTCDGSFWWRVTRDAFGDGRHNIGARTLASTSAGGFVGSYNPAEGTSIWRSIDPSPCGSGGDAGAPAPVGGQAPSPDGGGAPAPVGGGAPSPDGGGAPAPVGGGAPSPVGGRLRAPSRLLADSQRRGVVLSWRRSPGADRYRVMRAVYRVKARVGMAAGGVPRRKGFVPDTPASTSATAAPVIDLALARRFVVVGTTTRRMFVDRTARRGKRYLYQVVAVAAGSTSPPSNTVIVPSERPRVTFDEAEAVVRRLAPGRAALLRRNLAVARRRWSSGDRGAALRVLGRMRRSGDRRARQSRVSDRVGEEDTRDILLRLERRLRYATTAGG